MEGDQPRVRPFGTAHIFDGKLYIQTGKSKPVSRQLAANPKCEICIFQNGVWLRVAGELVEDDRVEAKKSMLDDYSNLRSMYDENDPQHPGAVPEERRRHLQLLHRRPRDLRILIPPGRPPRPGKGGFLYTANHAIVAWFDKA